MPGTATANLLLGRNQHMEEDDQRDRRVWVLDDIIQPTLRPSLLRLHILDIRLQTWHSPGEKRSENLVSPS